MENEENMSDESYDVEEINESDFDPEDREAFKRIKELVKKTTAMKEIAREKNEKTAENIQSLSQRLNDSDTFLRSAKKQIANLKITMQNDRGKYYNSDDYAQHADKTTEELEEELTVVKKKLEDVQGRLNSLVVLNNDMTNDSKETYKDAINNTIASMDKIARDCYSNNTN